jgi:ABC-type uncharacterized transport system permease subunit
MKYLFFILTMVAYGGSLGFYLRFLNTGKEAVGRLASLFLGIGLVAHYFALLERSRGMHTVPYHDLYGSMSLFGWLLALTYLGLELFHRQRSLGAFVLPFIIVFFVAAHLAPADRLSPPPARGTIFAFHVTLSILAYAAFALAFVFSLIFLGEERLLRSHKLGDVVWRLPPLELLERARWTGVHRDRDGPGLCLGGPAARADLVLRSQVCDYAVCAAAVCGVFPVGADRVVARSSSVKVVHL